MISWKSRTLWLHCKKTVDLGHKNESRLILIIAVTFHFFWLSSYTSTVPQVKHPSSTFKNKDCAKVIIALLFFIIRTQLYSNRNKGRKYIHNKPKSKTTSITFVHKQCICASRNFFTFEIFSMYYIHCFIDVKENSIVVQKVPLLWKHECMDGLRMSTLCKKTKQKERHSARRPVCI